MATMMFRVSPISILKTPRLRLCRGGWPEAVVESRVNVALRMAADYVEELLDSDINRMDGIKRNKT